MWGWWWLDYTHLLLMRIYRDFLPYYHTQNRISEIAMALLIDLVILSGLPRWQWIS
jgi:hypothetical protein